MCRCHGARGGAPEGKRNGSWKHGLRTKQAIARRREFAELIRGARAFASQI